MLQIPFYDPKKSYEDNYDNGPFGAFVNGEIYQQKGEPAKDYLGQKVYLPFGIPAGPVLNSNFVKAAFQKGFDVVVYKTVRTDFFPCHPFPNVLAIHPAGDLSLDVLKNPLQADTNYTRSLSITNSFGVPSKNVEVWQEDAKKAISYAGRGQVLVMSFMGTVKPDQTQEEFIEDYVLAAKLAVETGVTLLETNLSCPNIGNEGLVCYNLEITGKIARGIRKVIGNLPLTLKVGYYQDDKQLEKVAEIANEYANAIAGINTLQAAIVNDKGEQALPGKGRARSGVCGTGIKWAGLETVKRLKKIREKKGFSFSIEGIGGVMEPQDYFDYIKAGADSVMSATGAMWNPLLAQEIKKNIE